MKLTSIFVVFCHFLALANCLSFSFLRSRRDSEVDPDHGSVFDSFASFADNLGLKNLFREAQIKVLGATESLLDQTSEIYENFQDVVDMKKNKDGEEPKTSDLKKALRYLKTEARRLREDIEDEIEVEKEKAQEAAAAADRKESKQKIKKLNEAIKKLDQVTASRVKPNKKNKSKNSELEIDESPTPKKKNKKGPKFHELTTIIPAVLSLGDGFGRHM